ncbi:UDP-N-acetyl-D-mannosamine dehydrogenase [Alphaproteobacteria bacterium]|nr:UDP-N-acetyl-D-mannosamine dehydrogenase [Alphaproteobacteria bacterium]
MKNKLVSVIGLGYIGLPTAALLASYGYKIIGTDISSRAVDTINQGKTHILEPDLEAFVNSAVVAGRLKSSTSPQAADIYIICVPTPIRDGSGIPEPDIESVLTATRNIAPFVKAGDLIILESTSPVGTTEQIEVILRDAGAPVDEVYIAYCPERVLPGRIMVELVENDRIVGGLSARASSEVAAFYRTFVRGTVFETNAKTAELCKLTENSFRDVNIAFANELSLICEKEGIDVWSLIELANRHPRVNILQPGPGVGGHCIAVDPWFIVARDAKNTKLIKAAREVNNFKTAWVIDRIKVAIADSLAKTGNRPKVACFGLAFKPGVDDLRESPALQVALNLELAGHEVLAVEPYIGSHENLAIVDVETALTQADICVMLVKHQQFLAPDVRRKLMDKNFLDFCGALALPGGLQQLG